MPRANHLLDLVRAGAGGDQPQFRKALEAIIVDERGKQHHILADRLAAHLATNHAGPERRTPRSGGGGGRFFHSSVPERRLADLILPESAARTIGALLEEHGRRDLLRAHNLEPRHRLLLTGPPGNGKTSLAEALATELADPLFTVRYESVIGSFLGETAGRLDRLFSEVRERECVLFFDDFDVLGRDRGGEPATGEDRRVVSSLLLQIDALPSHVVVVAATNRPELLDRAARRRFEVRLDLPPPTPAQTEEWFRRFAQGVGSPLPVSPKALAARLRGLGFSELERFSLEVRRQFVLDIPEADLRSIITRQLQAWKGRSSPRGDRGAARRGRPSPDETLAANPD